ncbi:uncharacterized protein LOC141696420 [Apium graveolens]|uniref:uncharacterized protein LOC141696420 n=1 Tax=Apium graveolens TaxID=4045 RepID=UPI003D7AE583
MNALSWNRRGLGTPRTVRVLSDLVKSLRPDFLFLSETKSKADKVEQMRVKLGYAQYFAVNCIGRSGGLGVFWKNNVRCEISNYSQNHVDVIFKHNNVAAWRLSCFYGMPESSRRKSSWDLIRLLANNSTLPWCIIGDFNDLLHDADKWGDHSRPRWMLDCFIAAVEDSNLSKLDLHGGKFTWERSKDHDTIFLDLINTSFSCKDFRFRFENTWLREASFRHEVTNFWLSLSATNIIPKLVSVSGFMARWGRNFFHKFREKIKKQKEVVAKLVDQDDANTKFFHASASTRKRTNHIPFLEDSTGNQILDHDGMCRIVADYFEEIFKSSRSSSFTLYVMVERQVTASQNTKLVEDITYEEFTITTRQMHPDKSSGPDGLNPAFYQQANLNETNVVLIPKKEQACRSISDNVLVAFEVVHHMHMKKRGREGEVALKLDISKAYDRVE